MKKPLHGFITRLSLYKDWGHQENQILYDPAIFQGRGPIYRTLKDVTHHIFDNDHKIFLTLTNKNIPGSSSLPNFPLDPRYF